MRLLFDIGNTRAKCALYDGERCVETGPAPSLRQDGTVAGETRQASSLQVYVDTLLRHYGHDIECAVASVVGPEPDWRSLLPESLPLHRLSHLSPLPFRIVGEHPETIGADRLAACLGAWQHYQGEELVVVDAGTCITFDYLSSDGRYTPGVILPGMQMCLNAMHEHTALLPQLRFDPRRAPHLTPLDTEDCLLSGVSFMGLNTIEGLLRLTPQTRPILTGGDGEWLQSHMAQPSELCKNLLFEGLNAITI